MKYLLAIKAPKTTTCNAVVIFNDTREEYSTLIDGVTQSPLAFDTEKECMKAKECSPVFALYEVLPVHRMLLAEYPRRSVFSCNQFYYSTN